MTYKLSLTKTPPGLSSFLTKCIKAESVVADLEIKDKEVLINTLRFLADHLEQEGTN